MLGKVMILSFNEKKLIKCIVSASLCFHSKSAEEMFTLQMDTINSEPIKVDKAKPITGIRQETKLSCNRKSKFTVDFKNIEENQVNVNSYMMKLLLKSCEVIDTCTKLKTLRSNINYLKEMVTLQSIDLEEPPLFGLFYETEMFELIDLQELHEICTCPNKLMFLMGKAAAKITRSRKNLERALARGPTIMLPPKNTYMPKFPLKKLTLEQQCRNIHNSLNILSTDSIIFDMRLIEKYEEISSTLNRIFHLNFSSTSPINLLFMNYKLSSKHFHMNNCIVSSDSYFSLSSEINKESLVYIDQDAMEPMFNYDRNKTYIIAGLSSNKSKSLNTNHMTAKQIVKMEGLATRRLPLDLYLKSGSVNLPVITIFSILQTVRDTNDWLLAFKHIKYHNGLSNYGKEILGNRNELQEWYHNQKVKFYENNTTQVLSNNDIQISTMRKYLGRL